MTTIHYIPLNNVHRDSKNRLLNCINGTVWDMTWFNVRNPLEDIIWRPMYGGMESKISNIMKEAENAVP